MNIKNIRPISYGILAMAGLLAIYFSALTLVSGWSFTLVQFREFWYFILSLAVGFGIQITLYSYLRILAKTGHGEGKMLGVTGTTSTAAMISCCTHYLANLLPVLGAVGLVTLVAQYQVELFWIGLVFNLAGILYVGNRIRQIRVQTV